jgi:hypothetical protein
MSVGVGRLALFLMGSGSDAFGRSAVVAMRWGRSRADKAVTEFADAARAAIAANGVSTRDASLPDRVARYVIDGDDLGVIAAIRAAHRGGWSSDWKPSQREPRRTMYRLLDSVPPEVGLRWAHVLTAFGHWGLTLAPIAGGDWAELLVDDIGKCFRWGALQDREPLPCTYAGIEAIILAGGGRRGELLAAMFSYSPLTPPQGNTFGSFTIGPISRAYAGLFSGARSIVCAMSDYRPSVAAHASELSALALHPGKGGPTIIELLEALDDDGLRPFAPAIAEFLTGTSTTLALAAEKLAGRCPPAELTAALQDRAVEGAGGQQLRALRALWKLGSRSVESPQDTRSWAMDFVATATSAAAKALAREWADLPAAGPSPGSTASAPGPRTGTPGAWQIEMTPALRTALLKFQSDINVEVDAKIREYEASEYPKTRAVASQYRQFSDNNLRALIATLTTAGPPSPKDTPRDIREQRAPWGLGMPDTRAIVKLGGTADLTAEAMLTVLSFVDSLRYPAGDRRLSWEAVNSLRAIAERSWSGDHPGLTLTRIRELLDQLGLVGNDLVFDAYSGFARGLPDAAVTDFVESNLSRFAGLLNDPPSYYTDDSKPYLALATLPALPADVADTMYRVALGTSSRNRELAQDTLADDPQRTARLNTALRASDADTRAIAAAWLGRSGTRDDIAELESAYHAEKTERVSQAQLDALAALGNPPSTYLNRDTLTAAAATGMRKGPAPLIAWIDWDTLPPVRWSGTDEVVDISILQWLLGSAAKLKSPEPTVAIRYYCALFDADGAERFGDHLLNVWIDVDHQGGFGGQSVSAVKCKGLLAICAATCRANAAPIAEQEIRGRYGYAASQCRSLLGMLAWIDQPNAIQLVLSISTKFRTKGIQDEARKQVDALAARRGWTRAELADRTVPDAGFGADGTLVLDYGPRQFTARIGDDLKLYLSGPDGKPVKALPAPRVTDDDARVAEAKRLLSGARKAVKTLVPQQVARLEEAIYAERSWPVDDWERYLHRHPIVAILCRRLVWAELTADGTLRRTFRPLDDGTLTDSDDDEVTLDPESHVTVVRPGLLDGALTEAWRTHLSDYEVTPLFDQLGERYEPAADHDSAQTLTAFEGHLLEAFTLRSMARKLGYTRGETGDGGVFFDYVKTYPSLGLVAVLGFSGSQLPEENTTVALTEMSYRSVEDGSPVPLRDVPVLLLGAGHRDLAATAAAGPGYDPNWRTKVNYA